MLTSLSLKFFRIHERNYFEFEDGINFILGLNGSGKTTILEAIHYLCVTKSFFSISDNEAVNFKSEFFDIEGSFNSEVKRKIRIFFSKIENKKLVFKDDKTLSKASEILGLNPVVVFTPEDYKLTYGYSQERRKFVDYCISQYNLNYLEALVEYNKILKNRKALLEKIRSENNKQYFEELNAWSEKLIKTGAFISYKRYEFIKEFANYLKITYERIMENIELPEIKYYEEKDLLEKDFYEKFKTDYSKLKSEEINRKSNLFGPHREDFIFTINNFEIKKFGSEGQNKTFQAALKFAQYFFLKDKLKKDPLLLLDDPFGVLDSIRARKLSEFLKNVKQSFIAATDYDLAKDITENLKGKIISLNDKKL